VSDLDVVRAWKDEGYRRSLTPEQLARLPQNPAGPQSYSTLPLMGEADVWGSWLWCQESITQCNSYDYCNTELGYDDSSQGEDTRWAC
jgi:mersacidin/lichenicidin family type 2 lantibiotic